MKLSVMAAATVLLLGSTLAQAQTYTLSTSLDSSIDAGTVGSISFTQQGSDTRIDLLADWDSNVLGPNVFLRQLFLSYSGSSPLQLSSASGDSPVVNFAAVPGNSDKKYDYVVGFPSSNKGNRLVDGESISLLFAGTDADDFGFNSMVHLQGLFNGASVKVVTTPVPEAETWAMLALGLGSIVALRRRRG